MSATFALKGSGSGAVKAVQDFQKALKAAEGDAEKTAKATSKVERMAERLADKADPMRKYNREMQQLAEWAAQDAKNIGTAELAAKQLGTQLDRAGDAGNRAFGAGMQNNIASTVTQMASAAAALATVKQALSDIDAARKAAADNVVGSVAGFGELAQIAPTQQKADELVAFGRQLIATGVVKPGDEGQAASIAFALDSAGLSAKDKEFILKVGAAKFVRAEGLSQFGGALGQLQAAFGTAESGDARALANKAVAAAAPTRANAQQIAESVAKLAPGALKLGYRDEEAFAAESEVARVYGSASEAETRVRALFAAIDSAGINKGSLSETIAAVKSRIAAGETDRSIFGGSQEALDAYGILAKSDLQGAIAGIDKSQRDDVISKRFGYVTRDPKIRAAIRRQVAEGGLETVNQSYSEQENLLAAVRAEQQARLGAGLAGWVRDKLAYAPADWLGNEDAKLQSEFELESSRRAVGQSPQFSDELYNDLRDYMRRTAEATERLERRRPVTTRTE